MNCLPIFFVYVSVRLLVFSLLISQSFLHISEMSPWSVRSVANRLSWYVIVLLIGGWLFVVVVVFHLAKVLYIFISVVSVFYGWTLCSYCNSHQSNERQKTGVAGYVHRV